VRVRPRATEQLLSSAVAGNRSALAILRRDVQRVCDYFTRQGVQSDPATIVTKLAGHYGLGA